MKSLTHHSTLHPSFKIKCCVDRLRPPVKSGSVSLAWGTACRGRNERSVLTGCRAVYATLPGLFSLLSPMTRRPETLLAMNIASLIFRPGRCSRLVGRESGTPVASDPCSEQKFRLVTKFPFGTIDGNLPHTIIGKIMTFIKTDLQPSHLSADFSRDFLHVLDFAG